MKGKLPRYVQEEILSLVSFVLAVLDFITSLMTGPCQGRMGEASGSLVLGYILLQFQFTPVCLVRAETVEQSRLHSTLLLDLSFIVTLILQAM
jgi:hypothetical protein